jgi:hypothetical protein
MFFYLVWEKAKKYNVRLLSLFNGEDKSGKTEGAIKWENRSINF